MNYIIYKHTCSDNSFYIGMTSNQTYKRWQYGWGYMDLPEFWEAIKREGWKNITHEILEVCPSKEEAMIAESRWIKHYFDLGHKPLNKQKVPVIVKAHQYRYAGQMYDTLREVAKAAGKSHATIWNWIQKDKNKASPRVERIDYEKEISYERD